MSSQPDINDLDLHAYVDGELDAAHARVVEEAMARDAALAARIAAYRDDKAQLKRLYGPLADDPVPAAWLDMIRNPPKARARRIWGIVGAIAAALVVVGGVAILYLNHQPGAGGDVVEAALQVRGQTDEAVKSVTVGDIADARRYDTSLDQIVHAKVNVPDLNPMGYRVQSLRFYANAAEISYRDGRNRLLTVYLRPSDGKIRFDQFEARGLRICLWQDDRIITVIAGDMSAAMMQRLASLTYLGLTA